MIVNIRKEILNGNINITLLKDDNGTVKDLLVKENNILYQLTTSENQKNLNNSIYSIIELGNCEKQLRFTYNIDYNISLLIFKVEIYEKGLNIPIIEYEIYNSENNKKLELDKCNDITLYLPVNINESNLFKYNSSNEYYNDECNPYTTEKGSDIILQDRRNEYTENKMALCEKNCDYIGYNQATKRAICECEVKKELNLFSSVMIDTDKLLNEFKDIKTSSNINTIKCYKLIFSIEGFASNLASYIILPIIFFYIISVLIFFVKGFKFFENIIKKIKFNSLQFYFCFLCIRKFKNTQNALINEGMKLITEELDIRNLFKNMLKLGITKEQFYVEDILQMSDECKNKLVDINNKFEENKTCK
jgi:hypothetical protein